MPFSLLKYGLSGDYPFEKHPDLPQPTKLKKHYDVVIIGGGGHGVAVAYYLAKYHGITNVAILEKVISAVEIPHVIRRLYAPTT